MRYQRTVVTYTVAVASLFLFVTSVLGDQSSSTNYSIIDSEISSGQYATSSGFSLYSLVAPHTSTTTVSSSFSTVLATLGYPYASSPIISATAGTQSVALTWSAASVGGGWTVGSYAVGTAGTSGGPYTFSNVGTSLSSTRTGLTAGSTYYFVVRVLDSLGFTIATSTEISSVPTAASTPTASSGGSSSSGGGGVSSGATPGASAIVVFSGKAYPKTTVTLLKDAQVVGTTVAKSDATFTFALPSVASGNYLFSLYSEDVYGNRSSLLTFPVNVSSSATKEVKGIFVAPTITTDKSQVKKGDSISIFGQTSPNGEVTITVNSDEEHVVKVNSDKDGIYLLNFDTDVLELGEHHTRSMVEKDDEVSTFSKSVSFEVGSRNVQKTTTVTLRGDLNEDGRVNLVDFSIAAFWYKKGLDAKMLKKESKYLNGDGKINLIDFSILAYNWTG